MDRLQAMRKILIIDDDKLVLKSVDKILKQEGYATELAHDAEEAIGKAVRSQFDLVISDIRMPGKSGVEAAQEISSLFKENSKKEIPIIFITGFSDLACALRAEHLGEVILKPFDLNHLVTTIREYL